jgi:hypothetical protein
MKLRIRGSIEIESVNRVFYWIKQVDWAEADFYGCEARSIYVKGSNGINTAEGGVFFTTITQAIKYVMDRIKQDKSEI